MFAPPPPLSPPRTRLTPPPPPPSSLPRSLSFAFPPQTYLQVSPGFADALALWDAHHLNHASSVGVPLLCLLADALRCLPADAAEARGFVHLQLDGLARAILSRRMRAVYSHLTSGVRVRHNCALALLGAVAARSRTLAWETLRAVDFSLPAFATLANPPRKAKAPSNATHTKQSSPAWCGADPLKLPARHVFVRFALAFFAHPGDPALIRSALGVKALFGNVLRKLAADPPALAREALVVLRDVVMSPSGGVPARLRAALMSDAALEQLAAISGTRAGGDDERRANEEEAATTDREEGRRKRKRRGSGDAPPFGGERGGDDDDAPRASAAAEPSADDARADAANLAHDALTRLCLDPAHGLCPSSALGRWTLERRGGSAVRSARVEGGGSGGRKLAALTRLLRALRPTESRRHADLLLAACSARPRVAAAYIPRATHSLDPRASVPWLAAATLLGRIAGFAAEDPAPLPRPPPAASIGDAEGAAFVAASLPPSLTRHALAKGVAHDVGVVAHASLCLLLRVARAIRVRVTRLDHAARDAREAGDEDAANAYAALAERARRAALADVLPDPRALADAHARAAGDGKNGDGDGTGKGGGAGAGGATTTRADAFVRAHAINALAEYAELAGGDALAEAKVDPARFLPDASASLARIPAPELAAAIRLLAARGGDREVLADLDDPEPEEEEEEEKERHRPRAAGAREEEDDEDDSEDDEDDSEALAPHSAAHSALAAAAGEAAFRVASRRAAEAASHRVGSHVVPGYPGPAADAFSSSSSLSSRGHVLAVLRVAAGASCARVRRAAASLAAAHFASSGALEDPEAARREAGAWVAALPAAPEEAAEAARGFLAEAAGEAARRGPAALDAAAAALRSRRERARGARVAARRRDASRGGAGADDYVCGDAAAAAAARDLDLEEGSHGSSSLDLEFSGLAACAIPACVKVLRSAKKTRLQRLAVASYVAAATRDAIIQQRDPAPLAALALEAFARGDGGERGKETPVDLRAYPALESLVAFAATVVEGGALALAPKSRRESSPERRPPPSPDAEDHPSSSPSSSAVALLGADRVSLPGILRRLGPRAAEGACGALAVAAHGPSFPRRRVARGASAASAVAFAATRAAGEGRGRGGAGAGGGGARTTRGSPPRSPRRRGTRSRARPRRSSPRWRGRRRFGARARGRRSSDPDPDPDPGAAAGTGAAGSGAFGAARR